LNQKFIGFAFVAIAGARARRARVARCALAAVVALAFKVPYLRALARGEAGASTGSGDLHAFTAQRLRESVMQEPQLAKVCDNISRGEAVQNAKALDAASAD